MNICCPHINMKHLFKRYSEKRVKKISLNKIQTYAQYVKST